MLCTAKDWIFRASDCPVALADIVGCMTFLPPDMMRLLRPQTNMFLAPIFAQRRPHALVNCPFRLMYMNADCRFRMAFLTLHYIMIAYILLFP